MSDYKGHWKIRYWLNSPHFGTERQRRLKAKSDREARTEAKEVWLEVQQEVPEALMSRKFSSFETSSSAAGGQASVRRKS